jgi:arsenate reductase-like glutaredoxin family protein
MKTELRDDAHALQLLLANPKIMIRPVLATVDQIVFGVDEAGFQQMVG